MGGKVGGEVKVGGKVRGMRVEMLALAKGAMAINGSR